MKLVVNRENFQKLFQIAAIVAPQRSPKPILQNVKLEAFDNSLILTATDTEVGVRLRMSDVDVKQPGAVVIPVGRLNMIMRESSEETLTIEGDESRTKVSGRSSKFELQGQNPSEFPEVPDVSGNDCLEVKAGVLRELIRRTLFATDTESSRYALGGVLLEHDQKSLISVGTDGRRLAKMEGPVSVVGKPDETGTATIVPARAMQLIERILPDDEALVQLLPRANDLVVKVPNGLFVTRLVEGRFPKWRDVIPKRTETNRIELPIGPMYSALRQAAIVSSEESRGVDFVFSEGNLILSNSTSEVGQSRIEMPVAYSGPELAIMLDHRYMADFLKVLPPDQNFTMDVASSDQAAFCQTADHYGYVIMPLARDRK
jgi:DNA polymerase-3 subunit beta